jgi:hypothetical protein
MNTKAVQMIVIPAHEQLDHTVQIGNRQAISQPDPAPNRRVNIPKQHLQPQQQRRVLRAHSPTTLPALPPEWDGLLGIEDDEHAVVPDGRRDRAPAAQFRHDLFGDPGYGSLGCLTKRVETAVGQHIAHRRSPAQAASGPDQRNPRARLRCSDRPAYSG